jgi:K+-transporting ATPase KdpF subunit
METVVYSIGGIVSALLFAYLMLALLKPEWFA